MKRAAIVLGMMVCSLATAAPKQSRSVMAADGWLKSMTDATTIAPMSYDKKKPLAFTVQGDATECAKLKSGKATSMAEIKALKACFIATWNHVAKEATLELADMRSKELDGAQIKFGKTAPKGTTWVAAYRRYAGQDLTINLALGPDYTVLAVWFVYLENDGE